MGAHLCFFIVLSTRDIFPVSFPARQHSSKTEVLFFESRPQLRRKTSMKMAELFPLQHIITSLSAFANVGWSSWLFDQLFVTFSVALFVINILFVMKKLTQI